jgi:hypothetical protein
MKKSAFSTFFDGFAGFSRNSPIDGLATETLGRKEPQRFRSRRSYFSATCRGETE